MFHEGKLYIVRASTFKVNGEVIAEEDQDPDDSLWYLNWDLDYDSSAAVAKEPSISAGQSAKI